MAERFRAATAAKAMAAMTSSSMSGVFPPLGSTMPILPGLASMASAVPTHGKFRLILRRLFEVSNLNVYSRNT